VFYRIYEYLVVVVYQQSKAQLIDAKNIARQNQTWVVQKPDDPGCISDLAYTVLFSSGVFPVYSSGDTFYFALGNERIRKKSRSKR